MSEQDIKDEMARYRAWQEANSPEAVEARNKAETEAIATAKAPFHKGVSRVFVIGRAA